MNKEMKRVKLLEKKIEKDPMQLVSNGHIKKCVNPKDYQKKKIVEKLHTSKIGIFWYHKGDLIKSCALVVESEVSNGFLDLQASHYKYWNEVCSDHPELRIYEYEDISRGRVVMKVEGPVFIVYSSTKLVKDKIFRDKLVKEFSLPAKITKFVSDLHYENPSTIDWDD